MNTDNLSVLGLTIDYGPYGWLEDYDPNWTPNTTDAGGRRYRFAHQPAVAQWNLLQLANALYPLVEDAPPLEASLRSYQERYQALWSDTMAAKLGLHAFQGAADSELFEELESVLQLTETDMTLFFRNLADLTPDALGGGCDLLEPLQDAFYQPETLDGEVRAGFERWLTRYLERTRQEGSDAEARRARMHAVNPRYVLRNYLAQLAIDAAEAGDFSRIREQLDVLRRPYQDQPGREEYAARRPDWARTRVGCSQLSCSS